ncbi:MAG: nucleotide exchange factor GrpE [Alphaproteobacteria bacterium]
MSGDKSSEADGPADPTTEGASAAPADRTTAANDPAADGNGAIGGGPDGGGPGGADAPAADWQAEAASLKDQLLRALAETENVRRRAQRDVADARRYGPAPLARDLLAVADNLQRALQAVPDQAQADADSPLARLAEGMALVARELDQVLARNNISRVPAVGQPFDHNRHEAMMQVDDASVPANTVVQEMQAGYVLHDRLLRPAMVAVSRGGAARAPATGAAADGVAAEGAAEGSAESVEAATGPGGGKGETLDTKA